MVPVAGRSFDDWQKCAPFQSWRPHFRFPLAAIPAASAVAVFGVETRQSAFGKIPSKADTVPQAAS